MVIIDAKTRPLGVMAWPAGHTLSPPMQNAAIEKLGLNWIYVALPVPPEQLAEAYRGARAMGFVGLNITIPHKESIIAQLDELDPLARAIGAVNTVLFRDGRGVGFNTDAEGYTRTVAEEGGFDFSGRVILQIGSGGAGRAMAAGAAAAGATRVMLTDVVAGRAASLAEEMKPHYPQTTFEALPDPEPATLRAAAASADLIANATPLGMREGDPLPLSIEAIGAIEARHTVFDAVYTAARTPLLREAERRGARVVPGLGMLARQGARALEIWSGQKPDEGLMIRVLKEKLGMG